VSESGCTSPQSLLSLSDLAVQVLYFQISYPFHTFTSLDLAISLGSLTPPLELDGLHSEQLHSCLMPVPRQSFGEDVGGHSGGVDVLEVNGLLGDNVIADEVVAEIDVFGVGMVFRILRQANAALAVGM
jgi:hypothetical protein